MKCFTWPEWATIGVIVLIMALIFGGICYQEKQMLECAFPAWVKQTGNPKNLTYDEWRALVRVSQKSDSTTVVFVPVVQ